MAQGDVLGAGEAMPVPLAAVLQPPNGLEQILAAFGDIYEYIRADGRLDPKWYADFLTRINLPFPLLLSWDTASHVNQITCHKRLAEIFTEVFQRVQGRGLQEKITTFGGCFAFRQQRTGSKLSTHAWGIAIDLNPQSNAQGSAGDMDAEIVEIFRGAGFVWGGEWTGKRKDPMHFQFCTGY